MTSKLVIRPYSMYSKSAKALAEALGVLRNRNPTVGQKVINWGAGGASWGLNKPSAVSRAVNKVATFSFLKAGQVRTPDWTTNREEAKQWFREGAKVMCRTKIDGHSGKGIVIPTNILDFPSAPLYTKFIAKDAEYRVHVFNGKVIDARQKVPSGDGRAITSTDIFTHTNGYVFRFADPPQDVKTQAIAAVKALGLDFGAVDVITKTGQAYVLEVNTAPGLTGTTITRYVEAIKGWLSG